MSHSSVKDEAKLVITPEEAASLLLDGEYVHNFVGGGFAILGCDYVRADALAAFADAEEIEIGGPTCKALSHPIIVHAKNGRSSFFEADMAKVEAFETARAAIASSQGAR